MVSSDSLKEWITEEEMSLVETLKKNVQNKLPSKFFTDSKDDQTAFLLRWLRARDLNLSRAQEMLENYLTWREENKLDKILNTGADPTIVNLCRWNIVGQDKFGHPVIVCPMNEWDLRKLSATSDSLEKFDFWVKQYFEAVSEETEAMNKARRPDQPPITQIFIIYDLKGFPYTQVLNITAMKKLFSMASVYEKYYPEVVYSVVVINIPWFYAMCINLLTPFLSTKTLSKIHPYTSMEDWQRDIQTEIDPSIVPVQYGGTNTNPIPPPQQLKYIDLVNKRNERLLAKSNNNQFI